MMRYHETAQSQQQVATRGQVVKSRQPKEGIKFIETKNNINSQTFVSSISNKTQTMTGGNNSLFGLKSSLPSNQREQEKSSSNVKVMTSNDEESQIQLTNNVFYQATLNQFDNNLMNSQPSLTQTSYQQLPTLGAVAVSHLREYGPTNVSGLMITEESGCCDDWVNEHQHLNAA